jgi:hypothetical protein
MNTFLNNSIKPDTLGILYLCKYEHNPPSITVVREIQFDDPFNAVIAYSEIPNPESQVATGYDQVQLFKKLEQLHSNLNNPEWVKNLGEYL